MTGRRQRVRAKSVHRVRFPVFAPCQQRHAFHLGDSIICCPCIAAKVAASGLWTRKL